MVMKQLFILVTFSLLMSCASNEIGKLSRLEAQYEVSYEALGLSDEAEPPSEQTILDEVQRLQTLSDAGLPEAANLLGSIYGGMFEETVPVDLEKSEAFMRIAMASEDSDARAISCVNLAYLLMDKTSQTGEKDWLEIRQLARCAETHET